MARRGRILWLGPLLLSPFAAAMDGTVALPRPAPQLRQEPHPRGALERNASCEHCHADIAKEWRRSRHRSAYDNPEFQAALKREPKKSRGFCVSCHAPEASAGAFAATASIGVACVTCHTPLGPVLAAPGQSERAAPHGVLRTDKMSNGDACASCHEFSFPAPNHKSKMQRTMSEHRAAAGKSVGCSGCHMPWRGSGAERHRGHGFPGGHDVALVRSALKVSAKRIAAGHVQIRLSPKNTTHAVPTGDLFRRVTVSVEAKNGFRFDRHLARHYKDSGGMRRETLDDRVYRTPTTVNVYLPNAAQGEAVSYRVTFDRVAHPKPDRESEAKLDGQILIAEGKLAP